ncbi:hypothetical protein [Streptomyces sp. NPDC101166]|uniref:hypothetical protein n=1 Tax=Streptomyces sp. NPDC101166 TaxID=3366120 RepID=UPI00382AE9E8
MGATQLPLSADRLADLNERAGRLGVQGDRYNEHYMPGEEPSEGDLAGCDALGLGEHPQTWL